MNVYGVENIKEVIEFFNGERELEPTIVNTREEFYQHQETQNVDNYNQEEYATDSEEDEFDLSDFDVEEEDI